MSGPRPLGVPMLNGPVTVFGPDGAARIEFRCAPGLHRVPDGIVQAAVADQLTKHIGRNWIACLITSLGHGVIRGSAAGVGTPDRNIQSLLTGIAIALNKHESREGHWVVAMNLDEHEVAAIWRDQDGDVHLAIDFGEPVKIGAWTEIDFAAQASAALDELKKRHRDLDKAKLPEIRRALGEEPALH